jgi:hypothetical protein
MGSVIVDFQLRMCSYSLRVGVPFRNCSVNVVGLGESCIFTNVALLGSGIVKTSATRILSRGSYLYHDVKYT